MAIKKWVESSLPMPGMPVFSSSNLLEQLRMLRFLEGMALSSLENNKGDPNENIKALEDVQNQIVDLLSDVDKKSSKYLSSVQKIRITPEEEKYLDYLFSDMPNWLNELIRYNDYFISLLKNESLRSGIKIRIPKVAHPSATSASASTDKRIEACDDFFENIGLKSNKIQKVLKQLINLQSYCLISSINFWMMFMLPKKNLCFGHDEFDQTKSISDLKESVARIEKLKKEIGKKYLNLLDKSLKKHYPLKHTSYTPKLSSLKIKPDDLRPKAILKIPKIDDEVFDKMPASKKYEFKPIGLKTDKKSEIFSPVPKRVNSVVNYYSNVLSSVNNGKMDVDEAIKELIKNFKKIEEVENEVRKLKTLFIKQMATVEKASFDKSNVELRLFNEMLQEVCEINNYHKKFINFLKDKQAGYDMSLNKIRGKGLPLLYPSKMLVSFVKLRARINAVYDSKSIRNQTKNLSNGLHHSKIITNTVYNHLANI